MKPGYLDPKPGFKARRPLSNNAGYPKKPISLVYTYSNVNINEYFSRKLIKTGFSLLDLNTEYLDLGFGRGGPMSASARAKRMRTSFKHHQLRTMKSYFAINHNPDAKDLKQLSQKTGLPKRVLQVSTCTV